MKLYPAIDLRNGQVVRLTQGDYDKMTVYGTDPCAQARQFVAAGAKYLHVVDLDGAKDGTLSNYDTIAALAKQGGLYIEVGGGIRTEERIEKYLSLGVGRCILGQARGHQAVHGPGVLEQRHLDADGVPDHEQPPEAAEIRPQQKYPCHRRFRLR